MLPSKPQKKKNKEVEPKNKTASKKKEGGKLSTQDTTLTGRKLDRLYKELDYKSKVPSNPHNAKKYKDDKFSIAVDNVIGIYCKQYVGERESLARIISALKNENRVMLQGNPGIGKTTLIKLLIDRIPARTEAEKDNRLLRVPNFEPLKVAGIEKILILLPTTPITEQLHKDFTADGLNATKILGGATNDDIRAALDSRSNCVICCYDSLDKIEKFVDDRTLLVVDEFHQLASDYDFRSTEKFNKIAELLSETKRVLLMSATPNYMFCKNRDVHPMFGFRLCKVVAEVQQEIRITPKIFKGKQGDVITHIINEVEDTTGITAVKFDSVNKLKAGRLEAINSGLKADLFCSKETKYKEGNDNYKALVSTGRFNTNLDIIFFTTLLEAGVSIKEPIGKFCIVDSYESPRITQLYSRGRLDSKNGTNEVIHVELFQSLENSKKKYKDLGSIEERFKGLMRDAQRVQGSKEEYNNGGIKIKLDTDDINIEKLTYTAETEQGEHVEKINMLYILHKLDKWSHSVSRELTLKRIERFDNRVEILPTEVIEVHTSAENERAIKKQKKEDEEISQAQKKKLRDDFLLFVAYVVKTTKNKNLKEELSRAFGVNEIDKTKIDKFKHDNSEILSKGVKIIPTIKAISVIHENERSIKLDKVVGAVCLMTDKAAKDMRMEYLTKYREDMAKYSTRDLSRNDRIQVERLQAIKKKFKMLVKDIKRGKSSSIKTAEQLTATINKAIGKEYGDVKKPKAVQLAKRILDLEDARRITIKKTGKQKQSYKVVGMKKFEGIKGKIDA